MTLNWGNFPNTSDSNILPVTWRDDFVFSSVSDRNFLPYGQGRSYGDSCLNEAGVLLATKNLNHFLSFDLQQGLLRCESGVVLADILTLIIPCGWILPVLPGTKFVSVGGAIANDIHGKNHHQVGTFGCHVTRFELLRSNGERVICSSQENVELFKATIGGLGLTGLVLWAEIKLIPIKSPFLITETISFRGLEEFFHLAKWAEEKYTYTVAWLDCQGKGKNFARGLFMCANHTKVAVDKEVIRKKAIKIPFYFPSVVLNKFTISAFNEFYYQLGKRKSFSSAHYDDYFFPLDGLLNWNKIYGKQGFLQYQFVLSEGSEKSLQLILTKIAASRLGSFLSVLKTFGNIHSPGMLSFPMAGVTLALDFPNRPSVFALLNELDKIVQDSGGRVYPAKDARMSSEAFKTYYPGHQEFTQFIDPKFSSSFWRRVTKE